MIEWNVTPGPGVIASSAIEDCRMRGVIGLERLDARRHPAELATVEGVGIVLDQLREQVC